MSSDTTSNLHLPYLQGAQAQKHVTVNETLRLLDALVQLGVVSRTVAAQPASPIDGQVYILPPGKTGADWGAMANGALAYWRDGVWAQLTPLPGWTAWIRDETQHLAWSGAAWAPIVTASAARGFRNRLLNGAFAINQRSLTSVADDAYCFDRFYILAQTGSVTVGALTDPETGRITGMRLTQPDASAKRIGIAQIVESADIRDLRSTAVAMAARVRCSGSQAIRMAILELTGTADTVTSDVVSTWTSTTYTAGNFFIAGVNVIALGATTPTAATWTDLTQITGTFGASLNNAVVMVWAEGTLAQNATLDFDQIQLEPGASCGPFARRPLGEERVICQRYFEVLPGVGNSNGVTPFAQRVSTNIIDCFAPFKVSKRIAPALVTSAPTWVTTGPGANNQLGFYNNVAANYATLTGALTLSITGQSTEAAIFRAQAGTSFSGSSGDVGNFYVGAAALFGFDAEL